MQIAERFVQGDDLGVNRFVPEISEQAINFRPPGKYAAVLGYDGHGSFALAIATKKADNSTAAVDSGATAPATTGDLAAYQATLQAVGYTVQLNSYPTGNLLAQTQSAALTLAGTLP